MRVSGVIIFSGYNMRAVIALVRTAEARRVPYAIIAASADDAIYLTDYASHVRAVRSVRELEAADLERAMLQARAALPGAGRSLVAPTTEALIRFLLERPDVLERTGCELPVVDAEMYRRVSDKQAFGELCRQHGLAVPAELSRAEAATAAFVAKPKTYVSATGKIHSPCLVRTISEREDFFRAYDPDEFYFQEYVSGRSVYLLLYVYRDGRIARFSQENMIQQEGGKSILAARSSDWHLSPVADAYAQLFRETGFYGLVMVEFRIRDGLACMIEANPRCWGPSQLFVDAGVDFFSCMFEEYGLADKASFAGATSGETLYFWDDGVMRDFRARPDLAWYGYSADAFAGDLEKWSRVEVFARPDTRRLYEKLSGHGETNRA